MLLLFFGSSPPPLPLLPSTSCDVAGTGCALGISRRIVTFIQNKREVAEPEVAYDVQEESKDKFQGEEEFKEEEPIGQVVNASVLL